MYEKQARRQAGGEPAVRRADRAGPGRRRSGTSTSTSSIAPARAWRASRATPSRPAANSSASSSGCSPNDRPPRAAEPRSTPFPDRRGTAAASRGRARTRSSARRSAVQEALHVLNPWTRLRMAVRRRSRDAKGRGAVKRIAVVGSGIAGLGGGMAAHRRVTASRCSRRTRAPAAIAHGRRIARGHHASRGHRLPRLQRAHLSASACSFSPSSACTACRRKCRSRFATTRPRLEWAERTCATCSPTRATPCARASGRCWPTSCGSTGRPGVCSRPIASRR